MKTSQSRVTALLEVLEDAILSVDANKDGSISTEEVASTLVTLLKKLSLPWYVRMFINQTIIVIALNKALAAMQVIKREEEDLEALTAPTPVVMFVDDFDEEEQDILINRTTSIDAPELARKVEDAAESTKEAAYKEQLDRNEELLKILRSR